MTSRYQVDGFPDCDDATSLPASPAAQTWLRQLSQAIVRAAGLLHPVRGRRRRRAEPRRPRHRPEAGFRRSPDRPAHPAPAGRRRHRLAGQRARRLGRARQPRGVSGIKTVVLDSTVMPPSGPQPNYTPSAQASVASSIGTRLNVLLADHTITQILRSGGLGPARHGVRHAAAIPGRDRHDRRREPAAGAQPGGGPAAAVEPGPRPARRPAQRHRARAVAEADQPGRPGRGQAPHRAGAPPCAARPPGE